MGYMRLEHYSEEKLKREIAGIVRKHLGGEYKVFFFGSRVSGGGDTRSDIDVGIEGSGVAPRMAMMCIKDEISELPILYKIDVVDFKNVSQNFKDVANKHMELISA